MRRARLLASLALIASTACDGGVDVVARSSDAGTDVTKPAVIDPPANVAVCGAPSSALAVLSKSAEVTLFDDALKDLGLAVKSCVTDGSAAFAVDRAGDLWSTIGGKMVISSPKTGGCDGKAFDLTPSVMAFVWDPKVGSESLYAVVEGVLHVVDPTTLKTARIGPLTPALDEVRGLTGTADGWLLAFAGDPLVTIAYVDTTSAAVKTSWQLKSPDPLSRFSGGVPAAKGFVLVFGANAWRFDTTTGLVAAGPSLFAVDPGVMSVAASPCATLGK